MLNLLRQIGVQQVDLVVRRAAARRDGSKAIQQPVGIAAVDAKQ